MTTPICSMSVKKWSDSKGYKHLKHVDPVIPVTGVPLKKRKMEKTLKKSNLKEQDPHDDDSDNEGFAFQLNSENIVLTQRVNNLEEQIQSQAEYIKDLEEVLMDIKEFLNKEKLYGLTEQLTEIDSFEEID